MIRYHDPMDKTKLRVKDVASTSEANNSRALPLLQSFNEYALNYTQMWDSYVMQLVKQIINKKQDSRKGNLLVIGAGPQPTIEPFIHDFEAIYLLDPNPIWHERWKALPWHTYENVHCIVDTLDGIANHISPNDIAFDCIVGSHVWYYIKKPEMTENLLLLNDFLSDDGCAILSIGTDGICDVARLCQHIQPEYKLCFNLEQCLKANEMQFDVVHDFDEGDVPGQNKQKLINTSMMHLTDYVLGNDEYQSTVQFGDTLLKKQVQKWVESNMRPDPENHACVVYHQHNSHYIVSKNIKMSRRRCRLRKQSKL